MHSKLSRKIGTGLMAFMITVCFIPAMAGAFGPGDGCQDRGFHGKGHHRPALGIWRNPKAVEKLGLTQAQVKQIRDADFALREKSLALKSELDRLRLQMDKAFSEDVIDDTMVLETAKKISDLKGRLFVQKIEARLALGKILTADQINKLKLYKMYQQRKGSRQGKGQMSRHRSIECPDYGVPSDDAKEER